MMRVAIIGAGFSGLSLAWHLLNLSSSQVILFDDKGVGGGASGIAPGLLHPYPGEHGKRSLYATEALAATRELLGVAEKWGGEKVCLSQGILRFAQNEEQVESFAQHALNFEDIEQKESGYLIHSGMTVHCRRYLEGLYKAIENKGGSLVREKVTDLSVLSDFDQVVIAAGAGVAQFSECNGLPIRYSRGQIVTCRSAVPLLEQSRIGKGYVTPTEESCVYHLGSTYEKGNLSDVPDLESAQAEIFPKIASFLPQLEALDVIDCKAAVRVLRIGHYAPLMRRLKSGLWVFTGLGSRGLLYHAFLGRFLARAIVENNEGVIPREFCGGRR